MDELMISGKRYLSSLKAAREHGYHSDYIGQLIRGNKVKGQKVGRAWYVDADSLAAYLGKENIPSPQPVQESSSEVLASADGTDPKLAPELSEQVAAPALEEIKKEAPVELPIESPIQIKKDPEEHRVILTKVIEAPEPTLSIKIAKAEHREEEEKKQISGGLTYIQDDESLLPEIRKNKSASRQADHRTPSPVFVKNNTPALSATEANTETFFVRWVVLTVFAILILTSVTAISASLVKDLSVGSTESASVQFSLPY